MGREREREREGKREREGEKRERERERERGEKGEREMKRERGREEGHNIIIVSHTPFKEEKKKEKTEEKGRQKPIKKVTPSPETPGISSSLPLGSPPAAFSLPHAAWRTVNHKYIT